MSRMDRYYKVEENSKRRTSQNQDLYQKIYYNIIDKSCQDYF